MCFFFQAEDGIRDVAVTGVQTCALPISTGAFEQVGRNISSIYNPDHKNFSPRLGVAWDVTGKGTTVVRAGGSIVYSLLTMSTFMSQQNTQNTVTLGVGTVPTGATLIYGAQCASGCPGIGSIFATGVTLSPTSPSNPVGITWKDQTTAIYPSSITSQVQCGDGLRNANPCDSFAMNRNFRTPYVENWTLGIQHAFSGKLSIDATYVGNHGVKLPGVVDLNQPAAGSGWTAADIAAGAANNEIGRASCRERV